ncbi:uncharacterized protein BDZ99DRAFT_515181 [Mytilinidion resinicola]|uniref:Rhodopsin domain-containing protein n=1 Tax=Mytilinidion resinicola TaxID=574789 RepID=A0A6A6Z8R0_9PEZI|nr:uncharacterized protein BDZ99DRAFT_515181 [Mytilinidion resinicola]KAF2816597.1 hypothetical protein BDZ99DRAFT_515181 [Mytilinidion resinicola]
MPGGIHTPLSVLLAWPKPNYVDPVTRDWTIPAILIVALSIMTLVLAARFWARFVVQKNSGLDDWLIIAALPAVYGLTITTCLGARVYGFQYHSWDHTPELSVTSRKVVFAIELLYVFATSPTKVSILFFYRRMANGSISRNFILLVWASIAFVIVYAVIFITVLPLTCNPVNAFWNQFDFSPGGWPETHKFHCHPEYKSLFAGASISMVQDIMAAVLPIMLLWNLQLPRRQKLAIYGIFALGLVTTICGAMRIYYLHWVYFETYDISWECLPGWLWSCLEADLAVICASAPALKVFFRRYLNISTRSGRSGHSMGYIRNLDQPSDNSRSRNWSSPSQSASSPLPSDGIKVSTAMGVTIEDRGDSTSDMEVGSTRSSKELTSLPNVDHNKTMPSTPRDSRLQKGSRTMVFATYTPEENGDAERQERSGRGWRR